MTSVHIIEQGLNKLYVYPISHENRLMNNLQTAVANSWNKRMLDIKITNKRNNKKEKYIVILLFNIFFYTH